MRWFIPVFCFAAMLPATPVAAFCSYRNTLYYKTTLAEEFRDARWVVKAKVEAADDHWANSGDSWTIYKVRVLTRYKGPPARTLRLFTFRDSGGFYLDKGMVPNLDADYLLFLDPATQTLPRGVRGVVEVNYECGQSKSWTEMSPVQRRALTQLAGHRAAPPPHVPARAAASGGRRGSPRPGRAG